jgi:hypothetical protein
MEFVAPETHRGAPQTPFFLSLHHDNNPLLDELRLKTGQELSLSVPVKDDHTVIKFLD